MVYGGELVAQNNNVELSSLPFKPPLGGIYNQCIIIRHAFGRVQGIGLRPALTLLRARCCPRSNRAMSRITRPRWVRSFLSFRLARLNRALSAPGSRAPGSEVPRPWETSRSWAEPWRRRSPPARQQRAIRTPAGAEKNPSPQ